MACSLPFSRVLPFPRDGAILTGRRKGKKWVYIAAGLMGGGKIGGVRGVVQAGRAGGGAACIPPLGTTEVELDRLNIGVVIYTMLNKD